MDNQKIKNAMDFACSVVRKDMDEFKEGFPGAQSRNYKYQTNGGLDWTDGFWTGMLFLSYEYTKDKKYLELAEKNVDYFKNRLDKKLSLDHHDIGFLYSPSCVADYKITGNEEAKKYAIKAAEHLMTRYQPKGKFIQAWGAMSDEKSYFLIIDCLMNLPLLFWASEVTGDTKYADIAKNHLYTALDVVIRDDFTTYHTYRFDKNTGEKLGGKTAQGYSDNSCWARGQAWGVYGTALAYHYTKDESIIEKFEGLTKVFIEKLPKDNVPYWDMIFTDGDEPRDTSSAAIAICGIIQMSKYRKYPEFEAAADRMLEALIDNYTSKGKPDMNVILTDAMYSRPAGHNPEAAIYGDYYFMEALMRKLNPDWKMYW